jgi:hypothetical protein
VNPVAAQRHGPWRPRGTGIAPRRRGWDRDRKRKVGREPVQVEQVAQGPHDFPSERKIPTFDLGRDAVQGPQDDRVFLEPFLQVGETKQFHDELFTPETRLDLAHQHGELLHELVIWRCGGEFDTAAQALAGLAQGGAYRVGVQLDWRRRFHSMHPGLS